MSLITLSLLSFEKQSKSLSFPKFHMQIHNQPCDLQKRNPWKQEAMKLNGDLVVPNLNTLENQHLLLHLVWNHASEEPGSWRGVFEAYAL